MIGRAIAEQYSLPQNEDLLLLRWKSSPHPDLPMITVVHEDRPMLKTPDELETSKEKYQDKRVIFLVRDPRDVIVSSYFEMNKRGELFGENPYEDHQPVFKGELSEFIDQSRGGFDTILRYYNIWAANRHIPEGFLLVRYEDLKRDPAHELRNVLDFLGLQSVAEAVIQEAVRYASFENMRKMEKDGNFQSDVLKPAEKSDEDSYKTRKGKVGGYTDYLTEDEIQRMNTKLQDELSAFFGYGAL